MGNTTLLNSSSIYAKRHINVLRRQFVFPVFRNFSETPCMKVDKDFPRLMNEGRLPESGRFYFLLSTETLPLLAGNSLLVIQKAKLLNMNSKLWFPPQVYKSLRRFRQDNNHLEKFDTY